ncbi:hypothetical protein O9K51_10400 [Purpureocillium lavendulum]|uniref:Uncharacterized protein n=1 Tax=Purpureocillium lavendulum TaxID=1247861 RepID=A0AB34FE57_9HYPO|nr:hypothetical protein O9K51_10400 [Purpureocillium lavendulum]
MHEVAGAKARLQDGTYDKVCEWQRYEAASKRGSRHESSEAKAASKRVRGRVPDQERQRDA